MREVISVQYVEDRVSKDKKPYKITHVLMDDGTEAEYWGDDVKRGDMLEVFFHFNKVKARKTPKPIDSNHAT